MKLIKKLGMATSEKRETMSSLGFDRVMTRDRMIQSLKGRALSRAFSSRSAGEDFMFKCMFKSLAKAQKDRKRWLSSEILKYMGLLPPAHIPDDMVKFLLPRGMKHDKPIMLS
jgi:hypothetical protein